MAQTNEKTIWEEKGTATIAPKILRVLMKQPNQPPRGALLFYSLYSAGRTAITLLDPYRISTPCGDFASSIRKICSQGFRILH